jgi:hypothetical protein
MSDLNKSIYYKVKGQSVHQYLTLSAVICNSKKIMAYGLAFLLILIVPIIDDGWMIDLVFSRKPFKLTALKSITF